MAFTYRGILKTARPYVSPPGPLADEATRAAWVERYTAEHMALWRALHEAHGVEMGNESELLWRMAKAHVPGLTMRSRSGPTKLWGLTEKAELRIAVDEWVADRERQGKPASIVQACTHLAKREPWATLLRRGKNPASALRGHYNTADLRWVKVVLDARAYDRLVNAKTLGNMVAVARSPAQVTYRRKKST